MLEYTVACGSNTVILEKHVSFLIKQRWKPLGGIAIAGGVGCVQAMIRDDKCAHDFENGKCKWCSAIDDSGNKS